MNSINVLRGVPVIAERVSVSASTRTSSWRGGALQQRAGAPHAGGETRWPCVSPRNCEAIERWKAGEHCIVTNAHAHCPIYVNANPLTHSLTHSLTDIRDRLPEFHHNYGIGQDVVCLPGVSFGYVPEHEAWGESKRFLSFFLSFFCVKVLTALG